MGLEALHLHFRAREAIKQRAVLLLRPLAVRGRYRAGQPREFPSVWFQYLGLPSNRFTLPLEAGCLDRFQIRVRRANPCGDG